MEAHLKYDNEKKKMLHYERKGYKSWNKSTICFDKYLKYPPLKVNGRYEIFAPKVITIHRLKHQKIPFMLHYYLIYEVEDELRSIYKYKNISFKSLKTEN